MTFGPWKLPALDDDSDPFAEIDESADVLRERGARDESAADALDAADAARNEALRRLRELPEDDQPRWKR